ncbi:MAG TPA: DUF885 domain-containing protein [Longimicrobium sp.]|nr:DUF885 domain-containing protein [Longimicrobium sp.]
MIRSFRWIPAAALVLAAHVPATAQQTPPAATDPAAARVNALADELVAMFLRRSPELGTFYGLPGTTHEGLTDNSMAAFTAFQRVEDDFRRRVMAVDPTPLRGRPEYTTLAFLREQVESNSQGRVCRGELWNVDQMFGWQVQLGQLAAIQPVGTADLRRQALARFRLVPRTIDNETANLREGLRQGYSAPKGNVRRVIEQLELLTAGQPGDSPLASPALRDSTADFRRQWLALLADSINPAIRRHRDFLANEYLPRARDAIGVAAHANGAACYQARVRSFTTLEKDPNWIHRTGLQQMEKIQAEMLQIARRSFGTDDVPALLERLRTDTAFTFRSREQILSYVDSAIARSKREMPKWFGRLPQADVVVVPYEPFEERSAAGASYEQPAADGSRPGRYRINLFEPERQSRAGMESTAFHEAIPGHHLQLALAMERPQSHMITRLLGNSGFAEGWGLYAERLADEMGLFSGDLDRLGLLSNEALRAARMVVDPGMHVLGWSRERAVDYMLRHTAESRTGVDNEVDRYIAWPGQATAYMTGMLEIRDLRDTAERELGPRFDVRAFHDRVLEDGTVPLPLLREKIEKWIAEEKAKS